MTVEETSSRQKCLVLQQEMQMIASQDYTVQVKSILYLPIDHDNKWGEDELCRFTNQAGLYVLVMRFSDLFTLLNLGILANYERTVTFCVSFRKYA